MNGHDCFKKLTHRMLLILGGAFLFRTFKEWTTFQRELLKTVYRCGWGPWHLYKVEGSWMVFQNWIAHHHRHSFQSLQRKDRIRKNVLSLPECFWVRTLVFFCHWIWTWTGITSLALSILRFGPRLQPYHWFSLVFSLLTADPGTSQPLNLCESTPYSKSLHMYSR